MSTRKSYMPGDGLSLEMGESFGGFDFEFGTDDGPDPELEGFSVIPDADTFMLDESAEYHESPQWVEASSSEEYDLGDFLVDASTFVDHSWLDPTQLPDPSRLPRQERNHIITELQELEDLWASKESAQTKFSRFHALDKDAADYQASIDGPTYDTPFVESREKKLASEVKLRQVIQRAMRQSTYGDPLAKILREAATALGDDAHKARAAMELVKREHGLAGNVFIRASAFPGLHNGKWADVLKKKASKALYVVADPGTKIAAYDRILGKEVVASVPWKEAFRIYAPQLVSVGYKVGSGDPQETLRRAFLAGPKVQEHQPSEKPIDIRPADMISAEDARRQFSAADKVRFEMLSKQAIEEGKLREKVHKKLASWVKGGFLKSEDALRLRMSEAKPMEVFRVAASLVVLTAPQSKYAGIGIGKGFTPMASQKEAWSALQKAEKEKAVVAAEMAAYERDKMQRHLAKMVSSGLLTKKEARKLGASEAKPKDVMEIASALVMLRKGGQPKTLNLSQAKYAGEGVGGIVIQVASEEEAWSALKAVEGHRSAVQEQLAQTEEQRVHDYIERMASRGFLTKADVKRLKQSSASPKELLTTIQAVVMHRTGSMPKMLELRKKKYAGSGVGAVPWSNLSEEDAWNALSEAEQRRAKVSPKDMQRLTRYARRKLSEGSAGRDFDFWLKATFSKELREAAKTTIRSLRATHEGLSGHLYVDADAYASVKGTTGCEEGALKHRANNIKFVMAMDRCAGCVFKNAEGYCTKYGKQLVEQPPVADTKAYQKEMIRLANATDAEHTATIFAPSYDPDEFGLSSGLDSISLDHTASTETLGEILFGGMDLDL